MKETGNNQIRFNTMPDYYIMFYIYHGILDLEPMFRFRIRPFAITESDAILIIAGSSEYDTNV